MSIAGNKTITVRHLSTDQDTKSDYGGLDAYTDLTCYIEPISEDVEVIFEQQNAYEFFKAYDFGAVYDIRRNDRITDNDGNVYIVRNVKKYKNDDIPDDMELLLAKKYE